MLLHKNQSTILQLVVFAILFTSCLIFFKRRFPTRKKRIGKQVGLIVLAITSSLVLTYMFFALYEKHYVNRYGTNETQVLSNQNPETNELIPPNPPSDVVETPQIEPPKQFQLASLGYLNDASSYTESDASTILTSI